jgi:hypothetical protein
MYFHLIQAGGDLEQNGRLEGSGHGLPDIDIARYHYTINRRFDGGVTKINFYLPKLRNLLFARCNGGFHLRFRGARGGRSGKQCGIGARNISLCLRYSGTQPVSREARTQSLTFRAYAAGSQFSRTCGFNFGIAQAGLGAR